MDFNFQPHCDKYKNSIEFLNQQKEQVNNEFKLISLEDVEIPIIKPDDYCGRLKLLRGRLNQEYGITHISFSIPFDAMGNRLRYNEEITCSEIMLFKNGEGYYDHPDFYGDAIYRFYDDEDGDELGVEKFVEWLYKNNYEQP